MNRAMLNPAKLLKLLAILALTFDSIDSSDGVVPGFVCPSAQVDWALNLTAVGFGILPDGFVKNEFLTHLTLDGNKIPSISANTFSLVPKLTHLSLANNKLTTLDLRPFSELQNLETLVLSSNCKSSYQETAHYSDGSHTSDYDATSIDEHPCNLQIDTVLSSLQHLYLENNNIQQLSVVGSGRLPSLTHLHLSENPIIMKGETVSALNKFAPAMTHLYLNNCSINQLDASELPTVTSLYLDRNDICTICSEYCSDSSLKLATAAELTILSVSHNQITRIEMDSFNYTINLVTLDLSNNKIYSIREGTFDGLHQLQFLYLNNNNFVKLTAVHTFAGLIDLKVLTLGSNNISYISNEVFQKLTKLQTLKLNDNNISSLESGTFSNLENLETLSLAGNQLSKIPHDCMSTSGSLFAVNLDNNNFTSIEHIPIVNAPSMLALSLKENPLTIIKAHSLKYASENLTIFLGNICISVPNDPETNFVFPEEVLPRDPNEFFQ